MKTNCSICGVKLTEKNLDINKMLSRKETKKLYSIRRKRGICSECSISMLIIDIIK